jgi:serine/threonine-protein kinase
MSDVQTRLTTALADRYRVDRELGAGGMATVYLAHDLRHERDVAIKVLHPDLGAALGAERFLSEIKTTAKLQHPHILPLLDSGAADGLLYYVMPYVRGETLRARLARGPVPIAEAAELLRNVLQALQYAHAMGIMHRDIKPENILLGSGTAVVADFGIAKALSTSRTQAGHITLTQAGTAIGTPAYMAPEQAAGDPNTDYRADLYAWGIVAYEVLTGAHPFARHVTPQAMITAHMTEVPANLSTKVAAVPPGIAGAVAACLSKNPGDRPASAADALAQFETYRTPSALPARATSPIWRRRVVAAVLVVSAGVAGLWRMASRAEAAGAPRSLAVLPFDIGADTANAYLADGISTELTTKLSRVPGLVVRAYSSSKNVSAKDPQEAAKALGVATVVTATVRRDKERLRVNASLIAGSDARVLWSDSFDERDVDQFALQDRLTAAIAKALEVSLSQSAERAIKARRTDDPIAHDLVQRSRFEADHLTPESVDRAIKYANEAIARDSLYVDAWTALAYAYGIQADDIVRPATILAPMRRAAERVASLDPNGADGHGMAGLIATWYTRDSATAERELHKALEIDSTNGYALPALASFVAVRHPDSSGTLEVRALRHNPWSTLVLYFTAWLPASHRAMSPDTAVLVCGRLRQSVPPLADNCDALRLDRLGKRAEAQAMLRKADTTNLEPTVWAWRALGAAFVGDTAFSRLLLNRAEEESRRRYVREDFVTIAYAELGDRQRAYQWAVRAFDSRASGAVWAHQRLLQRFGSDAAFRARLDSAFYGTAASSETRR